LHARYGVQGGDIGAFEAQPVGRLAPDKVIGVHVNALVTLPSGDKERGTTPTGVLVSLGSDVAIRRFAEREHNVVHWSEFDRGGHFFALEQPELFVGDVRKFFGALS
jgi:pimeloyl-ACP methyl ester carboxylesterase